MEEIPAMRRSDEDFGRPEPTAKHELRAFVPEQSAKLGSTWCLSGKGKSAALRHVEYLFAA